MPSSLVTRVLPIKEIVPIDGTELCVLKVGGWQVVERKDTNPQIDDLRVMITPDSILPTELADKLGITKYLGKGNRVRQVRLQQHLSLGIAAPNVWGFKIGEEVSEALGITKYEPPPLIIGGDQDPDHPLIINYTAIENHRNFPDELKDGEIVQITEKLEGTNSRIAGVREIVATEDMTEWYWPLDSQEAVHFFVGSHKTIRKLTNDPKKQSVYQIPLVTKTREAIQSLMVEYAAKVVILFGEIFGQGAPNGVKSMRYGRGHPEWRIFDIYIDGKYMNADEFVSTAASYGLPTAPILYRGPFSLDIARRYADMNTTLMDKNPHLSEGVIIRPVMERRYDGGYRRCVFKMKSEAYEILKAKGKVEEVAG
jgi:RNA ligase (TIGR02306 family)